MIQEYYNNSSITIGGNVINFTHVDFGGVQHLYCRRTLPYAFELGVANSVLRGRDVRVFTNDDTSKQGAHDLIVATRDYCLNNEEIWNQAQLETVSNASTLVIVYENESNIQLTYSNSILSLSDVEILYPSAEKLLVSNHVSETGLVSIVNELLGWMNE